MALSHWYFIEKLANHFGHEWRGFYTWLQQMSDFDGAMPRHKRALEAFEAWDGTWEPDLNIGDSYPLFPDLFQAAGARTELAHVLEIYKEWLELIGAGVENGLPAGLAPCVAHVTGTGRYRWQYNDGVVQFWVSRRSYETGDERYVVKGEIDVANRDYCVSGLSVTKAAEIRHLGYFLEMAVEMLGTDELAYLLEDLIELYEKAKKETP